MLYKNTDRRKRFAILIIRMILDLVAAGKFLFNSGWSDFKAVLKAHRDFERSKKSLKMELPTNSTTGFDKLIYPGCILPAYFIFGNKKFSDLEHYKKRS